MSSHSRNFKGGELPGDFSETVIILNPKVNSPGLLSQFHPTSLCKVLHKITAKTMANRLKKKILPILISGEQSAFVLDRLITDNLFITYESSFMVIGMIPRYRLVPLSLIFWDR
jgi:hypothetical protein